MAGKREATIDDLYEVEGKAELVGGELVLLPMTSGLHGFVVGEIFVALREYARQRKRGHAFGDGVAFVVSLPRRQSFAPDVAFATQPLTSKFVEGAPVFAVEVRSHDDYGPAAEREMAAKRADYFAAGTLVVLARSQQKRARCIYPGRRDREVCLAARVERLGESEIQDLHGAVTCDLDLGRLQVAVHHAALVCGSERLRSLLRDGQDFRQGDTGLGRP